VDVRDIGKQLNVEAVLEGSVHKSADRIRVIARLVRTADGYQIWSQDYDRSASQALDIEDDISRGIASSLKLQLASGENRSRRSASNLEAHSLYLQGRYQWAKRTPEALNKAIDYFQRTTQLDSAYAPAFVGLADAYSLLGSYEYGALPPSQAMLQARDAAEKALQLDSNLAEAHASLAQITYQYDWNWQKAESEFKRALELNPDYATAHHWYSEFLSAMGRFEESRREIEAARSSDPLSLIINTAIGRLNYFAGNNDQALRKYAEVLEMESAFPLARTGLGYAFVQQKKYGDAIEEFRKSIELVGRAPVLLGSLGYAYGMSGDRKEAMLILDEMNRFPRTSYVGSIYLAAIHIGLHDKERAMESLEKAYEEKSGALVFLKVEPAVNELRSDPRFHALLDKVGLPR
jgi:tetratricopeptide (TPR) repeat protein